MIQNKNHQQQLYNGFLISLAGAILFSTKAIFVKLAFKGTGVDAVTLLALRMLFALPFYLLAAWFSGTNENTKSLSKSYWCWIVIICILLKAALNKKVLIKTAKVG